MSRTITINGLLYYLEQRNYTKEYNPIRTVNRGITGLTIVQNFDEHNSLNIKILCYKTGYEPFGFGGHEDLIAAYQLMPVTIPDLLNGYDQWVWTSSLPIKLDWALPDPTAPFLVAFTLDKYYASVP